VGCKDPYFSEHAHYCSIKCVKAIFLR